MARQVSVWRRMMKVAANHDTWRNSFSHSNSVQPVVAPMVSLGPTTYDSMILLLPLSSTSLSHRAHDSSPLHSLTCTHHSCRSHIDNAPSIPQDLPPQYNKCR